MEDIKTVFETLRNAKKPLKGGEIAVLSSLDKKTVDKALKILTKEGKIYSPTRCFYEAK